MIAAAQGPGHVDLPIRLAAGLAVVGAMAQLGAEMSVVGSRFADCAAPGVVSTSGGTVAVEDCSFEGNLFAGLMAINGSLSVQGCHVGSAGFHPGEGGGVGLFGWEPAGEGELSLSVGDSMFEGNDNQAWYLVSGREGETKFAGNRLVDVGDGSWLAADAWFIELDTPPVLTGNCFSGPRQLLLDSASADLSGNAYLADPALEYTIHQQRCSNVDPVDVGAEILPDPDGLEICGPIFGIGPPLEYLFWLSETSPIE